MLSRPCPYGNAGLHRERILAAGCDDYLSKPVSYKDVLEMAARLAG